MLKRFERESDRGLTSLYIEHVFLRIYNQLCIVI